MLNTHNTHNTDTHVSAMNHQEEIHFTNEKQQATEKLSRTTPSGRRHTPATAGVLHKISTTAPESTTA
jgi:hypothetical protein